MVMNRYPYTPGHFMIIPHAHIDSPLGLHDEVWMQISLLTKKSVEILERFGASGVNTGINIKQIAGAGIPDHLHIHMVPRFKGDTNFITSISDTRVYGVDFDEIYKKISSIAKEVLG
jgi:diadenosine tetraphosphate (Ap4A) HIT family hydrolase